ncbi:hypothetical protein MARHY1408 [Marinobacter nauticus ATCC 49840]|nr:hypothetical protein MARHY1408 [Marinobacter nauticus ATCC 49840]
MPEISCNCLNAECSRELHFAFRVEEALNLPPGEQNGNCELAEDLC